MMFLTMPDIKIVTCSIGNMNCQNDWVRVLTPLGLDLKMLRRKYLKFWFVVRLKGYCLELKLVGNQNFNLDTRSVNPNIFALIVAANFSKGLILKAREFHETWPEISDSTYGWAGTRTGLSLYFYDRNDGLRENHKIELMSTMVSENILIFRRSSLLGRPYTPCSTDLSHLQGGFSWVPVLTQVQSLSDEK